MVEEVCMDRRQASGMLHFSTYSSIVFHCVINQGALYCEDFRKR